MQKFQKVAFFKRLVRLNRWSHEKNAGLFVEEKRWPTTCLLCGNNLGATGEPWNWAKVGWIWEFYRPLLFQKNSFFSRVTKTPKGSRYQDSVGASELATSGPFCLKMCQKWIGATGEPGYCVKVGWKRVKKRVRVKFLLLLLNKIVVLTFDRKWIHHQKWVQIKCCQ